MTTILKRVSENAPQTPPGDFLKHCSRSETLFQTPCLEIEGLIDREGGRGGGLPGQWNRPDGLVHEQSQDRPLKLSELEEGQLLSVQVSLVLSDVDLED